MLETLTILVLLATQALTLRRLRRIEETVLCQIQDFEGRLNASIRTQSDEIQIAFRSVTPANRSGAVAEVGVSSVAAPDPADALRLRGAHFRRAVLAGRPMPHKES